MTGSRPVLTARQHRAIAALMTEPTVTAAAAAADISRRTLVSWLDDAQFCAELHKVSDNAIAATVRRLADLSAAAVSTLQAAMVSDDAKTADRIRAADIVLGRAMQLRELHDLEHRLAALEARVASMPSQESR